MIEVRERTLEACQVGPRVEDTDELADGDLISEAELADAIDEEWDSDDPVVKALFDDLVRGEHAKAVMAEAEMRRVIAFNQQVDHRFVDGLGQLVARIPLSVYLHWTALYGHEFWDQPDALDFFAKRAGGGQGNPGLLIKTPAKPTIVKTEDFPRRSEQSGVLAGGVSSAAIGSARPIAATAPQNKGPRSKRGRWAA